jgi:hypothetical protein
MYKSTEVAITFRISENLRVDALYCSIHTSSYMNQLSYTYTQNVQ